MGRADEAELADERSLRLRRRPRPRAQVRLFKQGNLLTRKFNVHAGERLVEVVQLGDTDDWRGDDRLRQQPGATCAREMPRAGVSAATRSTIFLSPSSIFAKSRLSRRRSQCGCWCSPVAITDLAAVPEVGRVQHRVRWRRRGAPAPSRLSVDASHLPTKRQRNGVPRPPMQSFLIVKLIVC